MLLLAHGARNNPPLAKAVWALALT
eukprot:COSAG01_NODE_60465_length_294_cov_1.584615_1_plen_24_part_01